MRRTACISIFPLIFLGVALLALTAQDQKKAEPLTEGEIIRLLEGGVSPERVESLARDRGLSFEVTDAVERDLRDAGATDALLQTLREVARKAAPPAPVNNPPTAPAPPLLVIQTKPGEAQVYVDDVFSGKTSGEGVLRIPRLAPGEHHLRVTLAGYEDFEQRLDLPAGETTRFAVVLASTKTAAPPAPAAPAAGGTGYFVLDRTLKTPVQPIRGLAFSGDSPTLAALGEDGSVRVFRAPTGDLVKTIPLADNPKAVSCIAYSRDGKWIVVGEAFTKAKIYTGKLELIDAVAGQEVRALTVHHWEVESVAFSRDDQWLVSANWDKKIRVLEFPAGTSVHEFETPSKPLCVAISPDTQMIASGGADGTAALWERASGKQLQQLTGHTGRVRGVDFSPDGRRIASASEDGSARLWDVATGESLHTLSGHAGAVFSVSFSPDGKFLATGGTDDTVRLWEAATGQSLETLGAHAGVWQVAFSPDGKYLAAGYADGTINVWKKQD
jgi:Tol biopolymer transport system component